MSFDSRRFATRCTTSVVGSISCWHSRSRAWSASLSNNACAELPTRRRSRRRDTNAGYDVMRYGLISDIHANLPALKAVLHDIAARDLDATYHLGDLVGYAPWPNETVALLSDSHIPGIS